MVYNINLCVQRLYKHKLVCPTAVQLKLICPYAVSSEAQSYANGRAGLPARWLYIGLALQSNFEALLARSMNKTIWADRLVALTH